MCGICGQYNYKDRQPVKREDIEQMTRTMVHRGPDDEGVYLAGPLGLGFRRLSIIDLEGGHQPMSDREESVWVVFNGEIYNFPELRQELEGCGHVFRTRCDTEVIIHGYTEWGENVLDHLNGMFGLAIWDVHRRKLMVARDPMGVKMLYYRIENGSIWFGSEIRPVVATLHEKPEVDALGANLFLRYRYTPAPLTVVKGVRRLAAGTKLVIENEKAHLSRWYDYCPKPYPAGKSFDDAKEELLEIYKKAVKRQLLSDVPLGLLLSGGMDSGLLLGLMNLYGKEWPTFSIGYGGSFKDDELRDAAETASLFGSRHTAVKIDRNTFADTLPKIVSFLEEPIASSSIVPMYFVCQRARQDVKVALIGQGPDELFGGYRRHLGVRYGEYWRRMPGWVRGVVSEAIKALPRNETLKRGINSLDLSDELRRHQSVFSILPGEAVDGLFHDGLISAEAGDKVLELWTGLLGGMEGTDEFGRFQMLEVRSALPDELLMYADKLSMAHSLEVRVPYLDREVVEFAQRLPAIFKIRHGERKRLHRKVCESFLPKTILRRKKRGFAVNVVDQWFRASVDGTMESALLDNGSRIFQFIKPEAARQLLEEHRVGRQDNHKILFSLVLFEQWLRHGLLQ